MCSQVVFWLIPFFLGASFLSSPLLSANPAPYVLGQHEISEDRTDIQVYNTRTGHPVWKCRLTRLLFATWSPDHRAVTIVDDLSSGDARCRLLIWEEGRNIRIFPHLRVPARQLRALTRERTAMGIIDGDLLAGDSFEQASLSPDKKHLMIRSSENMNPNDWGELWCLTLASGRLQQICPEVSEAHWQGSRRVRFTEVHMSERPSRADHSIMDMIVTYRPATRMVN